MLLHGNKENKMNNDIIIQCTNTNPVITLHDCRVGSIEIADNTVLFIFPYGIRVSDMEHLSKYAEVEIGAGIDEFNCYLIHNYAFFGGYHFYGCEISLIDISKMLIDEAELELIDEFYTPNQLYWRFCINRKKRRKRLYDELVIQCCVPINLVHFRWEE